MENYSSYSQIVKDINNIKITPKINRVSACSIDGIIELLTMIPGVDTMINTIISEKKAKKLCSTLIADANEVVMKLNYIKDIENKNVILHLQKKSRIDDKGLKFSHERELAKILTLLERIDKHSLIENLTSQREELKQGLSKKNENKSYKILFQETYKPLSQNIVTANNLINRIIQKLTILEENQTQSNRDKDGLKRKGIKYAY